MRNFIDDKFEGGLEYGDGGIFGEKAVWINTEVCDFLALIAVFGTCDSVVGGDGK